MENRIVSVKELSENASKIVTDVTETGNPVLVTNFGAFIAAIIPVNDLETTVLRKMLESGKFNFDDDENTLTTEEILEYINTEFKDK